MGRRLPLVRIAMLTTPAWKPKIAKLWSKSQTAAKWRLSLALFVCALLAYAAAFAWHMLTAFDLVNLIRDANYDDSFYYFQIAYNLTQGKFSTFDGGITQTNGYHPVWMLLITPFYWIFDKETALFGIKAFEITLVAGGVALIALAAWLSRLAWPLLFAALPMLYRNPHELLLGLEAAAAMFMLSLFILTICLYMRDPRRWKWHLFAIAFALPWVRIEYIAVSLAATAVLCAIEWSRQERRALRLSELAKLWYAYIPLIGAAAGILLYFAYNGLVFGGIVPVSAATQRAWAQDRWAYQGGYNLVESFLGTLRFDVFDYEFLIAFEICAYLLIVWRLALRSKERRDWLLLAFLVGAFGLAAGHLAKFAQTVLISHPEQGYRIWYFVPAYMMEALIIPIRLYVAIWLIRRFIAPRRRAAANALSVGVFVIGAAFLLARAGFTEPFRWVDQVSGSSPVDFTIASYLGAQVMDRALPEGSVIGSWDADIIGYFSRFPVVNLDGLVNSYDFFRARHIQHTEGLNFHRRYGVTHFANARRRDQSPNNVIFQGAQFDIGDHQLQFMTWTYDPAHQQTWDKMYHSHWVWDSMKPHFDYLLDDVGVVSDGRMAQAFVKNCAPDSSLVWTWQENGEAVEAETNLYPDLAAMCVAMRVLPRSARQPAQAKTAPTSDYLVNLIRSRNPAIRSNFDVYHIDRRLIYAKRQCSQEDATARFFISVFPVDANGLSENHNQRSYDFLEFDFVDYGAIADDGMCWTEVELPDYPIADIRTGQRTATANGYDYSWEAVYKVGVGAYIADGAADFGKLAGNEPVIRSDFDVYLIDRSLIYAKEQCSQEDAAARFFVSVFPAYANSLPPHLRQIGYGGFEFKIDPTADGNCWGEVLLPDYLIAKVHTGQYLVVEDGYDYPWEGDVYRIGANADFERLEGSKPIIRSAFDVYLIDRSLIYTKQQCGEEDAAARFFVSVFPVDTDDISDDRRQYGYHTIEFNFGDYGAIAADGQCWTEVDLPNYPIDALHTGQYLVVDDGYYYPWEASYKVGIGSVGSYPAGAGPDFGKLEGREPVIRSDFDVYLIDRSLIYTKPQCSEDDVSARFFARVVPAYVERLPEHLRRIGHGDIEFKIDERDITADGVCWAEALLPDYPIAEIHTGQYAATADGFVHIWEGAYRIE